MAAQQHPLMILKQIDQQYRGDQLPHKKTAPKSDEWIGLGFKLDQQCLLMPNQAIIEIVQFDPTATPSAIPGAKDWMLGLISLRGQLLAVIDFKKFLYGESTHFSSRNRLIVIRLPKGFAGLLVDEILGIKHFKFDERATQGPRFKGQINQFLSGVFFRDNTFWGVCSPSKLIGNPEFINAAVH
jgi:twitching motility protein PilI